MMRGARWLVLASCSMAMLFASSAVQAGGGGTVGGGTITFVGALVAPTCNIPSAQDLGAITGSAGNLQLRQRTCVGAVPASANAAQIYNTSVVHLSNSESDQVLRYFANYVRTAQPTSADPILVTRTYE